MRDDPHESAGSLRTRQAKEHLLPRVLGTGMRRSYGFFLSQLGTEIQACKLGLALEASEQDLGSCSKPGMDGQHTAEDIETPIRW